MASTTTMTQHMAPELLTPLRTAATADVAINTATLVYSIDGKFLFQRDAHVIRVLNSTNGQLLHECIRAEAQPLGALAGTAGTTSANTAESASPAVLTDRQQVAAIALHPLNALQLIAAYEDGQVLIWDFTDEKILQTFAVNARILWLDASRSSPSTLLMVTAPVDGTAHWSLVEFSMKRKKRTRVLLELTKPAFTAAAMQSYGVSTRSTGMSADSTEPSFFGDVVVLAAGERLLAVRIERRVGSDSSAVANSLNFTVAKFTHVRDVTCVAVHPTALEFVLGDAIGQMYRYHGGIFDTNVLTARMHWHAHAVACIAYSADGNFLVSGGHECVFVSWHVETGRRAYLPRRSASIAAIATRADGSGYALALADNVLFQYNHVTKVEEWHALGLARIGASAAATLPSRTLVFDPVSNALVLNGHASAGVLQLYDPYKDRVLQSVVLTERNHVTRTDDEVLPTIRAQHLAFSTSGSDLVTLHATYIDGPDGKVSVSAPNGDDQSLRFWKRRDDGSFSVTTAIDAPHGRAAVTCLAYSPSSFNDLVVTGDANGEFKVWKKTNAVSDAGTSATNPNTIGGPTSAAPWFCQSVVQFRPDAITAVAFAADGSLLAVAYGHLLTLWDVGTNALRHVLASADGAAIRSVAFTGKTSPFVVLTTHSQVQVWNLLSFELWWRYDVPRESAVSVNAHTGQFLLWLETNAATKESPSPAETETPQYLVLVFAPESPVPVDMRVLDVGAAGVWTIQFHPKHSDLVVLDGASNVWRLGDRALDKHRRKDVVDTNAPASAFAAMFKRAAAAQHAAGFGTDTNQSSAQRAASASSSAATSALFDAPAHVLPSMTALYRSFMDAMLPKPHATAAAGDGTDGEDASSSAAASKRAKKKSNKKRKKLAAQTTAGDASTSAIGINVGTNTSADTDAKQKRMKLLVEKELANPALQQQTYSTLLQAFRKHKPHAAAK